MSTTKQIYYRRQNFSSYSVFCLDFNFSCQIGLFQKNKQLNPPAVDIIFFEADPPGFPVKFTVTPPPWIFFFINFWCAPLEFQQSLLYPLKFSIDILTRWVKGCFFSGKSHYFCKFFTTLNTLRCSDRVVCTRRRQGISLKSWFKSITLPSNTIL